MTTEIHAFEGWAIVELMGHVRMAGRVSEAPMFGTALLRIDIPDGESYTTQFASGGSIYRLTPCSEEVARAIANGGQPAPIEPWEIKRLQAPRAIDDEERRLVEAGYDVSGHSDESDDDEPFVPDPRD